MRRFAFLLVLAASAEEAPKTGVDAGLQKRIDAAIDQGRSCLERILCEGESLMKTSPETLRQQADALAKQAESLRQQAETLRKGPSNAKARQQIQQLLTSAKTMDAQAATSRKDADRLELEIASAPKAEPKRSLAPASAFFPYGHGQVCLLGLALVQSGMKPSDPLLTQIWERTRDAKAFGTEAGHQTYTLAVALMFVDGMMHAPCKEPWPPPGKKEEVRAWVQRAAETLAEGMNGGAWGYACTYGVVGDDRRKYTVSGDLIGSEALRKAAIPKGQYDYSNTQYAVLGLKAAVLCGARLPEADSLWRLVLQQFLSGQEPEGPSVKLKVELEKAETPKGYAKSRQARARGWAYVAPPAPPKHAGGRKPKGNPAPATIGTATMTAAGLTALLVGRSELELKASEMEKVEEGIRDGLGWYQENWAKCGLEAKPPTLNGYLLYGLERMGVLGNIRSVGGHDWYEEGAKALVEAQGKDGSWAGLYSRGLDTAFNLLFLTRGTRAAYAERSYEVVDSPTPAPAPGK